MKNITIITLLTILLLCSCGKEQQPLTVTPDSLTLYYESTSRLTTNSEQATFYSDDEYYATVDANGLVTAGKVGKTKVIVSADNGTVEVPVTVISTYDMYPDIDWYLGSFQSAISSKFGSSYKESTASSGSTTWSYANYNTYSNIGFIFKDGKVSEAVVAVPTKYTSMLTKHLLERYAVAGMKNGYYFFLNHDKNVLITLTVYSASLLAVVYVPYTDSKAGTDVSLIDFDEYKGLF